MSDNVPGTSGSGQDTTVNQSEVDVLNEGSEASDSEEVVSEGEETETTPPKDEEVPLEEPEEEEETTSDEGEEEETETSDEGEPTRPSWQLIKEKYPELAKDKDFRELYFREKAFTDIYPTLSDAKEAFEKAERLEAIDTTLVNGDIGAIISDLNLEVLRNISDKLLPSIYKADKASFAKAVRPVLIDMMHTVMQQAESSGDDNLKKSVRNVSRALTGSPDLPARVSPIQPNPEIEAERTRLQNERAQLFQTQNRNFLNAADKTVMTKLANMVADGLDPKGEFSTFTRQAIIEKTLEDIQTHLASDTALRSKLQHLHKLAAKSGFPDEYRARIISASLERAKRLIPVLRNKHRMSAQGKQSAKGNNKEKIVTKNQTVSSGEKSGGSISRGKIDTRKTSAEDFLNDRITYKK